MQRHQHGGDIYTTSYRLDFSANVNPLGMPQSVMEAACRGVRGSACYPDVRCGSLRSALSQKERVREDALIFGNGAAELIFMLVQAEKPKKALLVSPGFAEYEQALEAQGCEIVYYPLKREREFALGEEYLRYLTDDLDLIFLCSPNNPTGVPIGRTLLLQIADICEKKGIRMALDVCFRSFLDEPEAANLSVSDYPHLFLLNAFTKTYAMAGLRLGYGICADRTLIEKMERLRQPWSVSLPAQEAGLAALSEDAYVQRARTLVARERAWLKEKLSSLGFCVFPSSANFIFFQGKEGLDDYLKSRGILIRDCGNYRGLCGGYYRIAVKRREENEELIREIGTWQK